MATTKTLKKKLGRPLGSKNKSLETFKVKMQPQAIPRRPTQRYRRRTQKTEDDHRGDIMSPPAQNRVLQTHAPVTGQGGAYLTLSPEEFTLGRPTYKRTPGMPIYGSRQLQSQGSDGLGMWGYEGFEQMQSENNYAPVTPVYGSELLQSQSNNQESIGMITHPDSFLGQQDNSLGSFDAQFDYLRNYVPPVEEIDANFVPPFEEIDRSVAELYQTCSISNGFFRSGI